MGRPTDYSQPLADSICERIADGESLRAVCSSDGMPHRSTVFRWLAAHEDFRDQYARAREDQADTLADEIVSIADEVCTTVRADKHAGVKADDEDGDAEVVFDSAAVARNRLRVDARKWVASKLKPKKYGDRTTLAGDPDAPLQTFGRIEIVAVEPGKG
jgi:hypothetical protein